jgi:hypothetical protein
MPVGTAVRAVVAVQVAAALALVAVAAPTAEGGTAAPRWQPVRSLDHGSHGNRLVGGAWASGRAWFVLGSLRGLTVTSARAGRGGLSSFQTTQVKAPLGFYPLVAGSDIVYSMTRESAGVAPLLANGRVGAAEAPDPDPVGNGIPVAATRVGGRLVWALALGIPVGGSGAYRMKLRVCCDTAGAVVDLTSRLGIRPSPRPGNLALGVDGQERLWLAWADKDGAQAIELDSETLGPKTQKPFVAPAFGAPDFELACARTCRMVISASQPSPEGGRTGFLATWAAGERSLTRIALPADPEGAHRHPTLLAADYLGNRLAVAYRQGSTDHGPTLKVVAGDVRGARARPLGSAAMPGRYEGLPMGLGSAAAFTSAGFVFAQTYSNWGAKGRVLATVVPLR